MAKIQIKNSFITSSGQITISSSFVRFQDRVQAKNVTGSLRGTASYASKTLTASYALYASGNTTVITSSLQTGSIAKQTIWTNVTSGSSNTITGLNLSGNKWDVSVVEEWDAAVLDQYYNSCSLLCHFDSLSNNSRFIDNSSNNFVITSSGNVTINTDIYKFGGGSIYFDGTDDYINIPDSSVFDFGSGDFTIEYWEYRTSSNNTRTVLSRKNLTYSPYMMGYAYDGSLRFFSSINGSSWSISNLSMGSIILNSWTHYAVTRQGNTFRTFQNGTQIASTTSAITIPAGSAPVEIGKWTSGYFQGYIDELRITKGVARYTSNFTPASNPFPNSRAQIATRYVGIVGGINDKYADYGVEKLSNSSLLVRKLTPVTTPIYGSGSLSASIDRVYVNVLDYTKVSLTASRALTASYLNVISQSLVPARNNIYSLGSATKKWKDIYVSTSSIYFDNYKLRVGLKNNSPQLLFNSSSLVMVASGSNTNTASYATKALTASYALNASGGGSSLAGAQTFLSNGSQTVFTLNQTVANKDQILVVTNGVVQSRSGSNYTVSASSLTLTEAVQNGGLIDVRYINAGQGTSGTNGTSGTSGTSGASLITGSSYPITSSYARNSINSLDIPKIKSIIYTNSSYVPTTSSYIDVTNSNTRYITISGSNFNQSASVFIDNTTGSIVTYINSNKLNVNVVSKNIGTYTVYLTNLNGASTFKINGIKYDSAGYPIQYLVVAGGGGGGSSGPGDNRGGGGGGGGFVTGSMRVFNTGSFVITVGSGGSKVTPSGTGTNGNTSSFGKIIALGGGGGGGASAEGRSGGSGGGGGAYAGAGNFSGGGASQSTQLYGGFGNSGGTGGTDSATYRSGGGGGGAGGAGSNANASPQANGGAGRGSDLTGSLKYYSGGGTPSNGTASPQGGGGSGPSDGSANTGGGGGGSAAHTTGGNGGSGIIIIRYSGSQRGTGGTVKELGGYTIHTFFTSDTFTP